MLSEVGTTTLSGGVLDEAQTDDVVSEVLNSARAQRF